MSKMEHNSDQGQVFSLKDKKYSNCNSPKQGRQINKLLYESSKMNSPKMSQRLDKSGKQSNPTTFSQIQKDKPVNMLLSQTLKTTQHQINDTETHNTDDQQEKKPNNKMRTIFRGGIIGMMQGRSKKRKNQLKREDSKQKLKEEENKLSSLFFALEQLSKIERFQKAMRHFRDSLNLKPVRHDIELNEGWFIPTIYYWQTSPFWQNVLFVLAILFPLISFVEPPNKYVTDYTDNQILFIYEFILLSIIWIDIAFEYFHRYFDKDQPLINHYIYNLKLSTRAVIASLLLIDLIVFHLSFPELTYRFSRYLRPFLVFYYSHELRRTFISILKSMKQIMQLVIFISFLTLFIAIIGWRFIGDLDDPTKYDQYSVQPFFFQRSQNESNFSNLGTASSILYSLISFDSYPECMIPAYRESPFFSLYFIIYCTLLILILIPIPVSVVYDSFRTHRSKLVLLDRIKQREALLSCFITLDVNNQKSIDYKVFHDFISCLYLYRKSYLKRINLLYQQIDQNESMSISMNEFFDIIDVMEKNPQFQIPIFRDYEFWDKLRRFMNKRLHLKQIAKSTIFETLMILALIGNCAILFIGMSTDKQSTIDLTDSIDDYFFYIYIGEFLIKIIGLGIEKYFEDSWNSFDFSMVVTSFMNIVLSTTLSFLKSAKSAKATKLLRITKINRIFRIFKALRSIKFLSFLFAGFEIFYQVKSLIQKIVMCLPIVIRLVPIILMLFYIYTYIALENFNTNTFEHNQNSPYDSGYISFNSFYEGMLIFFQVMLEAGWSPYIYDIAYKFDSPILANFIFISFDFIIQFILLSLIKGIVWEVFTVVNEEIKLQEHLNQKQNDQSFFQKMKDLNNILFLKKAKDENNEQENQSILQKENKKVVKSIFQNSNAQNHKSFTEQIKEEDQEFKANINLTSEFRGIMLYEKILRNLGNFSHHNSIICSEGQIPDSPKLNEKQITQMNQTEESNYEKELIIEYKEPSTQYINQTKQIKTSPQKENQFQQLNEDNQKLQNSPVSIENLQTNDDFKFRNSQPPGESNKKRTLSQNKFTSQIQNQNSSEYDKKKFIFFNTPYFDIDDRQNEQPQFSEKIIQKGKFLKSKSLQQNPTNKQMIGSAKLMQPFQSLCDQQNSKIFDKMKSKEIYSKDELDKNNLNQLVNKPSQSQIFMELQQQQPEVINEENDASVTSNKISFHIQNKTFGDQISFFQNQDSSISEQPLKSDAIMKSYIEGPLIFSDAPEQIPAQRSYTNTKSNTPNDITLDNPCDDYLDVNRITNEQIFWLRKRIKPFSHLKKMQVKQRKEKSDKKQDSEVDFSECYIFSEDEDTIDQYQKQIHDFIQEDEQDTNQLQKSKSDSKKEGDEMGSLNFQYMMKRALLKESNMEIVKKLEIDYFQQSYGSFFNAFHEVNISPILRYESFLIYNLQRILRHKTLDSSFFFQILLSIENNLSNIILRKGSLVKFVFQDSFGNWFSLKEINKNVYPCLLKQGPWSYYDKVFNVEREIYVCRDFFMMNSSKVMQNLIFDFYDQLRTCARCLDHEHSFLTINPELSIFDFFTIFGQNKKEDEVISLNAQSIKKKYPKEKPEVQIYCKKVMVMFLSYIGECEQEKLEENETNADNNTNNNNTTRTGMLSGIFKQKDSETSRKKTKQNIQKLDMDEVNKKQAKDKDKINEQSTLPMGFIVEMIKSIQDLLDLYSTNLYLKVSELINQKLMSKNYFEEIMEENNQIQKEMQIKKKKEKKMQEKLKRQKSIFKILQNK